MILQIEYNNNNNNNNNNNTNNNKIFIEHQSTICPWCFTLKEKLFKKLKGRGKIYKS